MPVPVEPSVPLFPDPDDEPSPVVPDVPPFEPVPLDESVPFWLEPLLELSDDDPLFPDVEPLVLLDVPLEVDESVDPLVVLSLPSVVVSSFESVESDLGFCTGGLPVASPIVIGISMRRHNLLMHHVTHHGVRPRPPVKARINPALTPTPTKALTNAMIAGAYLLCNHFEERCPACCTRASCALPSVPVLPVTTPTSLTPRCPFGKTGSLPCPGNIAERTSRIRIFLSGGNDTR